MARMPKHSTSILELASRGAKARLRDLAFEAKNLIELFPHLHDSFDKDELPVSFIIKSAGRPAVQRTRKRRKMSAAARAKISAAQKARWAKQKAGDNRRRRRATGS